MKTLLKKYGHVWVLSYAFLYLPWFLYLEQTVTGDYAVMHTALDDYIPFNEYFIIPYLFWFVYVAGAIAYFFFTNRQDYYRLCGFLFVGMTISLIICTFFPNGTDLRIEVDPQKNFCAGWFPCFMWQIPLPMYFPVSRYTILWPFTVL